MFRRELLYFYGPHCGRPAASCKIRVDIFMSYEVGLPRHLAVSSHRVPGFPLCQCAFSVICCFRVQIGDDGERERIVAWQFGIFGAENLLPDMMDD